MTIDYKAMRPYDKLAASIVAFIGEGRIASHFVTEWYEYYDPEPRPQRGWYLKIELLRTSEDEQPITFALLERVSEIAGTKLIDILTDEGSPGFSEATPAEPACAYLRIRWPLR